MYRQVMTDKTSKPPFAYCEKAFIFGGAYSNLQATHAILEKATAMGFSSSEIIFTGDMIAYCANPVETVELIRSNVDHIIMGNCEEAIAHSSNDCGCGFEEGSECSILSNQWYQFCQSKIDNDIASWMGRLPREIHIQIAGQKFLATHASPDSINQFIFASDSLDTADTRSVDGYIVGHSGIPFISFANGKPWINSGASGMPANDGTARVWFATIKPDADKLVMETNALEYQYQNAQKSMREASLVNGYMTCLETGIWPSHDILPTVEKAQTGIPIKPTKKALKRAPLQVVA